MTRIQGDLVNLKVSGSGYNSISDPRGDEVLNCGQGPVSVDLRANRYPTVTVFIIDTGTDVVIKSAIVTDTQQSFVIPEGGRLVAHKADVATPAPREEAQSE